MADEAARSEWVHRNVDADLQFIFQESEVPEQTQYDLGQHYKSVRRFSALADDRAGVRQALQADFNLRADSAPNRAAVASVVGRCMGYCKACTGGGHQDSSGGQRPWYSSTSPTYRSLSDVESGRDGKG